MFDLIPRKYTTYNPFREMEKFFSGTGDREFRTDVIDRNDAYTIEAELPGFAKGDINVDVSNDILTISAERKPPENNGEYICRERFYGSFARSFDVSSVKVEGITVRYENGLLTLTLPKKDSVIPASRHLDIE